MFMMWGKIGNKLISKEINSNFLQFWNGGCFNFLTSKLERREQNKFHIRYILISEQDRCGSEYKC